MFTLLTETKKYKSTKKYKCPYCESRLTRNDMYHHIEKYHEEFITDNYPVGRIVYNTVNHTPTGYCMMCKTETKWDDEKQKYDTFCSDKCKEDYTKMAKSRMVKVYGKEHLLNDPEYQEKMLQNRKISGYYTFTSGGKMPYVGSYEKKFLEFMDKFLHVKERDIMPSQPVVPYMYNGEKHFWILDFYYIPYNLALDIKDGGDNPNNREMPEYRKKQDLKEAAIKQQNKFNYLRLENNDFTQLIECFLNLKELDNNELFYPNNVRFKGSFVHESVGTAGTIVGIGKEPNILKDPKSIYFVHFDKYLSPQIGVSKDKNLSRVVFPDEGMNLKEYTKDYISNENYKVYKFTSDNVDALYEKFENDIGTDNIWTIKRIFEHFTGHELLDTKQMLYTEGMSEDLSVDEYLQMVYESLVATLTDDISIPMIESTSDTCVYEFSQDINGYYVYNKDTQLRSKSYDDKNQIPKHVINYISKGLI